MRPIRFAVPVLAILVACSVAAQEKPTSGEKKPLTVEGSLTLRQLSDLHFSPDGTRVAFVVTEPPKGEHRARHIWMYEMKSGIVRQYTYSEKSEFSPRWSPDGKLLAFLSNRDGEENQIYAMRADSGEAWALTKGKRSIHSFEWSPDGKQIAFLAPDAKTEAEEKKEKEKDDAHVVDKDDKRTRLWIYDVATGKERALTPANWNVDELAWFPSSDQLAINATEHPESDQFTNKIYLLSASGAARREILAPRGPFERLKISPDGRVIGFVGCAEDCPAPHDLMLLPLGEPAPRNLTRASLDRMVQDYRWLKSGILLNVLEGFRSRFVTYTAQNARQDAAPMETNPAQFAVNSAEDVAFAGQTATTPQELWIWKQGQKPESVTHINKAWEQFALAKPEFYKYKSFDGTEIEAELLRPADADGRSKLPMVALIHGGPTWRWADQIETWGQLLAAHGYAVFYPNPRGSVGYGEKFMVMNRADWGGGDFRDIMAGIDDLIAKGVADPERLGIGGWSYGGYMSEWAVTQTTRFKAAVSGAGMADLISEYGTEEGPWYDEWFWGVPYEKPEGFLNSSPFLFAKNAKTPTLIMQGEADKIDPLGQSQELYRGLKRYGVTAEFVEYPREPHGFREEKHLVDRLNRILEWYGKYLKAETMPNPPKAVSAE
jgi:dipeptidyl aminopeptidase/acylaminoacyl peptidase